MKYRQKVLTSYPRKLPKPKVPENVKLDIETKANELVESFLKPEYIKLPPEDMRFNYVMDIYTSGTAAPFTSMQSTYARARMPYPHFLKLSLPAMKKRDIKWLSVKETFCLNIIGDFGTPKS